MNQGVFDHLISVVCELKETRYPEADCLLLAGSVVRGEATATSDLDIVVLYQSLPNAYRDSYHFRGWPVEAFVHDLETLTYFIREIDAPTGVPSLAAMVNDGVVVSGQTSLSQSAKAFATTELEKGPSPLSEYQINAARYRITDLIEDIKDARNIAEMQATVTVLYEAVADFFFRSQQLWSAKAKTIPRRLEKIDPVFAQHFCNAFAGAFENHTTGGLVTLAEQLLAPYGGFLFDGYRLDAPEDWKSRLVES